MIISTAVYANGKIYIPTCIEHTAHNSIDFDYNLTVIGKYLFVTNEGKFLTRDKTLDHVIDCGQRLRKSPEDILRSGRGIHSTDFDWEDFDITLAHEIANEYNRKNDVSSQTFEYSCI